MRKATPPDRLNWLAVAVYGGCVLFWIVMCVGVVWATH